MMVEKIMSKYPVLEDFRNPHVLMGLIAYGVLTLALAFFIGNFWAALCFGLAAYAVIGNDAVQTLMTYIHSNSDVPSKILFAGVAIVLLGVLWYGYLTTGGDISYGRLDAKGYADVSVEWYFAIFPLILVFLTRFRGIPVSTSLLMLSIFSGTLLFQSIVLKSAAGYLVAFLASFFAWLGVEYTLKRISKVKNTEVLNFGGMLVKSGLAAMVIIAAIKYALIPLLFSVFPNIGIPEISSFQYFLYGAVIFLFVLGIFYESKADDSVSRSSMFWRIAQTFTTVLLFSTWLMHDMVNIAVFLPSNIELHVMLLISVLFILGLAYTFYINGGPVGNIVTKKTSTNEIIAATMIDLVYFVVLLIFKEWSNIPMSTTWVFVGLLAGRQFAIRAINRIDVVKGPGRMNLAFKESWKDFSKIMVGLGISVFALIVVRYLTGT
ncbi:hypothetical protein N9J72_03135 [Candidatus Gracilibacteria bacterium]|nr:hypothetical protein [Candidatus Gracilibacteria bacterium]